MRVVESRVRQFPVLQTEPNFPILGYPVSGKHVVSAGDRATAEAARELLWLGGNAFDSAVGAVFTSMVAESTLTSAACGGCLLALPRESEPVLFDFFVDMPSGESSRNDLDFFSVFVDFGCSDGSRS